MISKKRIVGLKLVVGMALMGAYAQAHAQAMFIDPAGNVGVGTDTPLFQMDVIGDDALTGTDNSTALYVTNNSGVAAGRVLLGLSNNGTARFSIDNTATANARWVFSVGNTASFRIAKADTPVVEFEVTPSGDVNAQGTFNTLSDRNSKTNIQDLDAQDVLAKVVNLPLATWSYKDQPSVNHIGPMAQDFYSAFGLGDSDKAIASTDASGVALAAVQAIYEQLQQKEARIQMLESKIEEQEQMLARVNMLEELTVKLVEMQSAQGELKTTFTTN